MKILLLFSPDEVGSVISVLIDLPGVEVLAPPGAIGHIREVIAKVKPDIVITDLTDMAAVSEIIEAFPRERVIVYTSQGVGYAPGDVYGYVQVIHASLVSPRSLAAIVENLAATRGARSLLFPTVPTVS